MTKTIFKTLLATVAMLPLAGAAIADSHARTDLVIADLGQPETNPWVINRHRFERCVADALGVELKEFDDQNSEENHVPGVAVGRLVVTNYDSDYKGEYFISQVTQNNTTWGKLSAGW